MEALGTLLNPESQRGKKPHKNRCLILDEGKHVTLLQMQWCKQRCR